MVDAGESAFATVASDPIFQNQMTSFDADFDAVSG
jgi:hypothetical protein